MSTGIHPFIVANHKHGKESFLHSNHKMHQLHQYNGRQNHFHCTNRYIKRIDHHRHGATGLFSIHPLKGPCGRSVPGGTSWSTGGSECYRSGSWTGRRYRWWNDAIITWNTITNKVKADTITIQPIRTIKVGPKQCLIENLNFATFARIGRCRRITGIDDEFTGAWVNWFGRVRETSSGDIAVSTETSQSSIG